MGYHPASNTGQYIHIYLGHVNTVVNLIGTSFVLNVLNGFTLTPSDVGNIIVIQRSSADGGPLWDVLAAYGGANNGTLTTGTGPSVFSVKAIIFREISYLAGSLHLEGSLSNQKTFRFAFKNTDPANSDVEGMPVLVTDSNLGVDIFGGEIEQCVIRNYPGHPADNHIECECIDAMLALAKRNIALIGDTQATRTDYLLGDGSSRSFQLTSIPTAAPTAILKTTYGSSGASWSSGIATVAFLGSIPAIGATITLRGFGVVDGSGPGLNVSNVVVTAHPTSATIEFALGYDPGMPVVFGTVDIEPGASKTVGLTGVSTGTNDWYYHVDSVDLDQDTLGITLSITQVLVITYSYAAQLDYYNRNSDGIIFDLLEFIQDEGIRSALITGPLISHITFNKSDSILTAIQSICTFISDGVNNYWVRMDARWILYFEIQGTASAPWNIDDTLASDGNVLISITRTITREKLINAAIAEITKALGVAPITEQIPGNGTRDYTTGQPIGQLVSISLLTPAIGGPLGHPAYSIYQSFGILGDPITGVGKQWYWSYGANTLQQDATQTPIPAPPSGDFITVVYLPLLDSISKYINAAGVDVRRTKEFGSGRHDTYQSLGISTPQIGGGDPAQQIAKYYAEPSDTIDVDTYRSGLESGMAVVIKLSDVAADAVYIVDSVEMTDEDNNLQWSISLIFGAVIGDWKTSFRSLSGGASSSGLLPSGSILGSSNSGGGSPGGVANITTLKITPTGIYTVPAPTASSDGQILVVIIIFGATGYAVDFDTTTFVAPPIIDSTPNTFSTAVFAGNSDDGKWYNTGTGITGVAG